jgi:hypothetical protein
MPRNESFGPEVEMNTIREEIQAYRYGHPSPKSGVTFRGHCELLENVLVEVVSELKYHRQQLQIISAEKDTAGAVIQMGIAQAKNAILSEELKTQ